MTSATGNVSANVSSNASVAKKNVKAERKGKRRTRKSQNGGSLGTTTRLPPALVVTSEGAMRTRPPSKSILPFFLFNKIFFIKNYQNRADELPSGWYSAQDGQGNTYYYHATLNVTQWEKPTVPPPPATPVRDETANHIFFSVLTNRN